MKLNKRGIILSRRIVLFLLIFLLGVTVIGRTIKVGIYENKPLVFVENGVAKGVYIDILQEIARKENWELSFVRGNWIECLDKLRNGDIDILVAIAHTPEREAIYDFNKEAVFTNWGQIYCRKGFSPESVIDLEGKMIAGVSGDIYYQHFYELLKNFNISADLVTVEEYHEVLSLLDLGEVDAGVISRLYAQLNASNYRVKETGIIFSPVVLKFAFTKHKHRDLIITIDKYLKEFKEDPESVYYESLDRWLNIDVVESTFVIPQWLVVALIVSSIFITIFAGTAFLLQKRVDLKTRELRERNMELEELSKKLKKSEEKFRQLIQSMDDVVFVLDVNKRFVEFYGEWFEKYGLDPEKLVGKKPSAVLDKINGESIEKAAEVASESGSATVEWIVKRDDDNKDNKKDEGSEIYLGVSLSALRNGNGKVVGIVGVARDITEKVKNNEKMRYLSFHDVLTGLYNRAFFEEELKRLDSHRQLPISLIMIDINCLKLTNDIFGHLEGDRVIKEVAQALRSSCRKEDIIARWGGDEFVILLPKTPFEEAKEVGERIRRTCRIKIVDDIELNVSQGIATKEKFSQDMMDVLREAEMRMYEEKVALDVQIKKALLRYFREKIAQGQGAVSSVECLEKMKEIAERFGYAVGLDNAEMNKLLLLVEYHDIGIVALKNHSEKGLNYEKHPEVGYKIALNFPEIAPIAEYILYHHERWDGQGYPKKLRGNEIPLLSRLVSILDFYAKEKCKDGDPKQSDERIILELGKRAGSEFDPDLVKLFTKLLLL